MNKIFSSVKKILVIRLSSLGDILLTTPLIRFIKNTYPKIEIDYLLRKEYSDLLRLNPYINELILFDNENKEKIKSQIIGANRNFNYDFILDLQNNFRSRQILIGTGIKTYRFKKYSLRKYLLVKTKINLMKNLPPIPQRYADTLSLILGDLRPNLITDKEPDERLKSIKNIIGICPGAKHYTKRYPLEHQIKLCQLLVEKNFNVALFGGKFDKQICEKIFIKVPKVINLQNEDDILQTAANMKVCDLIICNDSGLLHIANSLNKKVIAIFGSTVKEFGFMPVWSENTIIVEKEKLKCRPCTHIGRDYCPKDHFKCMMDIKPEEILNLVISVI